MSVPNNVVQAATEATILKRKISALTRQLDEKKALIRAWADGRRELAWSGETAPEMMEIPTEEGTLSIIFMSDQPFVKKGESLVTLASQLTPPVAKMVIVEELAIAKTFKESWRSPSDFTKAEQKIIEKVIGWSTPTTRIEPAK